MTAPDRIWVNENWEAYLRPTFDGDTSGYIRADLARPTLTQALALPEVKALVDAVFDYLFWDVQFENRNHADPIVENGAFVIANHHAKAKEEMRAALAALTIHGEKK